VGFIVQLDVGEVVEIIPDVFLEVIVCPGEETHGLDKIKL